MKLSDLKGIFHRSHLTMISTENVFKDYWKIKLKPEADTTWSPGDHGIFTLPGRKIKGRSWRAFSVASTPQEGYILIGTHTGKEISGFKKALTTMEPGGRVNVIGPVGWFKVQDETSPIVMAAGGIGITNMRPIIKQLEKDTARPIHLVFQASDYFLFEDELLAIAAANPALTLYFLKTREETAKTITDLVTQYGNKAYYYTSGPRPYVVSIKKLLKQDGIEKRRIIADPFLGYKHRPL